MHTGLFNAPPDLLLVCCRVLHCRYVHLTIVAIQMTGVGYNKSHGGKWRLKMLKLWIQGVHGQAAAAKLFRDMCVRDVGRSADETSGWLGSVGFCLCHTAPCSTRECCFTSYWSLLRCE